MPFHHVGIVVSSFEDAKKFYLAALEPLGYKQLMDFGAIVGLGANNAPDFWLSSGKSPKGERKDLPTTKSTYLAFRAESRELVDQFYAAAIKAGGKDNGPPGPRPHITPTYYYGAFIYDADGNNIEAVHM